MQFQWLRQRAIPQELTEALAIRLNEIPGIAIPADALTRRPSFEMAVLRNRPVLAQFFDAIERFLEQIKQGSHGRACSSS
jgi:hypothetical protein